MSSVPRLFLALQPDDAVRAALAARRDACTWPRAAKPVKTARLHLTLHFLGEVPLESVPALDLPCAPFTLRFGRAALWLPHGVAVLEPDTIPDALNALHAALAQALNNAGLTLDPRPLRPHVTLARRAKGACAPVDKVPVDWPIQGYHLMSSAPAADGGYTTLRSWSQRP